MMVYEDGRIKKLARELERSGVARIVRGKKRRLHRQLFVELFQEAAPRLQSLDRQLDSDRTCSLAP